VSYKIFYSQSKEFLKLLLSREKYVEFDMNYGWILKSAARDFKKSPKFSRRLSPWSLNPTAFLEVKMV